MLKSSDKHQMPPPYPGARRNVFCREGKRKHPMIDDARKQFLLHRASALCEEHGARLLYLTLSGSLLHGTARPGLSDIDARGLFLPSLKSLALGEAPSHLNFSTALPGERNTAQDMDICLWPVARWLLELLPAGDSDALELLFSPSHAACTLYRDAALDPVFSEPLRLADVARVRSRMERALMKMEKSLSRESSLDTLKNVRLRLDTHASDTRLRLREVLDSLIEDCADDSLCLPVEHEGERGLRLCGRLYAGNVSLAEFGQRLNAELRRFGTGKAKPKAFAHVLRGIMQLEELQHEGRIRYPLAGREELSAIRQESTDRAALFRLLSRLRTRLTALDNRVGEQVDRGYDPAFAKDCALACYAAPPPLPSRQSRLDEISPAIVQLVAEKVDMLERTQNIRVLYACESGSRGWGFASADSDFDVRFIYVHAPDWYLGLAPEERRDVLETGTEHRAEGVLDLSGWELRKALKLFRISNPPLLEWLSSPQVYCERGSLAERLRKAAPHSVSLLRIWHHYRSMAKKNMAHYQKHGPTIKGWFYVLRPLLAARWVEERRAIPPMRFDLLLEGSRCDPEFRAEVTELVARKKEGNEKEAFTPPPRIAAFAEAETARQDRPDLPAAASEPENLNALFRDILRETWGDAV